MTMVMHTMDERVLAVEVLGTCSFLHSARLWFPPSFFLG